MPYWINESLVALPAYLWIYAVLGGIWALAILPRSEWRRTADVCALAIALGSGILTAWMFVLGTIGAARGEFWLRFDVVFVGTVVFALIGAGLAWRKRHDKQGIVEKHEPFAWDGKLLLICIVSALVIRWIVTAYWSFTAYDALWVYGYEGRLYTLVGHIPSSIGYYPQFIPLQYAYGQLAVGAINDHVARVSIMFLHIGSILAAYTLGARLINRRTGFVLAAIWTLYPHVGEWSRAGDLEIPLTMVFTLAAAFFLQAWTQPEHPHRRRYALIGGLMLGLCLWTKPTGGAFILGVLLLVGIEAIRVWRNRAQPTIPIRKHARKRLETVVITEIVAAPLGVVWYIRNMLYGYAAVDFPHPVWTTRAQQSGIDLSWLVLALIALIAFIYLTQRTRPNLAGVVIGGTLVIGTVGLSMLAPVPRPLTLLEWVVIALGSAILFGTLWRYARERISAAGWHQIGVIGAALALALPYFATYFFLYSYHYRLSFAVVPLLIFPTAAVIAHVLTRERVRKMRFAARGVYAAILIGLSVPGITSTMYDLNGGRDYLWTDEYPDDAARYRSGNAALMNIVDGLNIWKAENPGERLIVSAPQVDRLPFFFPVDDIRVNDAPTRLAQVEDAQYFIYGIPESPFPYENVSPFDNQMLSALGRTDIMRRAWGMDDGIFRYDVYELNLANRFTLTTQPNGAAQDDVVIGGFARYVGYDISGLEFWEGRRLSFTIYWEVIAPPMGDYITMVHLRDRDGNLIANWDAPTAQTEMGYYSTWVWEPGEYIRDVRGLQLPDGMLPVGEGYQLVIGLYDSSTLERLPVTVNGAAAGDDHTVENRMQILATPP